MSSVNRGSVQKSQLVFEFQLLPFFTMVTNFTLARWNQKCCEKYNATFSTEVLRNQSHWVPRWKGEGTGSTSLIWQPDETLNKKALRDALTRCGTLSQNGYGAQSANRRKQSFLIWWPEETINKKALRDALTRCGTLSQNGYGVHTADRRKQTFLILEKLW